jgi:hypothetical protein
MVIAVLAAILALAACNNFTGPGGSTLSGETVPEGKGLARIQLNAGEGVRNVRTALPGMGGTTLPWNLPLREKPA